MHNFIPDVSHQNDFCIKIHLLKIAKLCARYLILASSRLFEFDVKVTSMEVLAYVNYSLREYQARNIKTTSNHHLPKKKLCVSMHDNNFDPPLHSSSHAHFLNENIGQA